MRLKILVWSKYMHTLMGCLVASVIQFAQPFGSDI